jgi:F-box/TPR repeat protein Pof3
VICRSIPNITELTLVNCSDWRQARLDLRRLEQLEYLRLCSDINAYIPIVPPSLKHLDLGMSCKLTAMHIPDDEVFDLPLLESLNCDGTPDVPMSVIKRIAAKSIQAGHLKKLLIGRRLPRRDPMSGHEEGYPDYPASDSVTELSLSTVSMSQARFFDVLNLYPNVRKLDASENNMLTGVAVRDFVNRGITSLNVNKCSYISPDAVEWARSQGVYVEHKVYGSIPTFRRFVDSAFATSAWS